MLDMEILAADRRLRILQLLAEAPGYMLNLPALKAALARVGHWASSELLESDLAWMKTEDLVEMHRNSGLVVAELSQRGMDAASDPVRVPGVRRPEPGECRA